MYRSEDIYVVLGDVPLYQEYFTQVNCSDDFSGSISLIFANPQFIDSVNWSNGQTGLDIDSLSTGNYSYTITTNNSCSFYGNITVTEIDNFYLEAQTTPFTDTAFGSLTLYVFGGTQPFTYILDGDTITAYTTGLDAGTYQLIVTDAAGCIQEETVVIQIYRL